MKKLIHNETAEHKEALQYYFSLGKDRSIKAVAQKFGVSLRTAEYWSNSFGWAKRVEEMDKAVAERVERQVGETLTEVLVRQKKIIRFAVADIVKRIQAGTLKLNGMDLVKLMELELEIHGWKFNRNNVNVYLDNSTMNVYESARKQGTAEEILEVLEGEITEYGKV